MPNPSPGGDELSRRLRALREAAGPGGHKMLQTKAEELTGIGQPAIAKFEKGHRVPSPELVDKLCDAYGASPKDRRELRQLAEDLRPRVNRAVVQRDVPAIQKRIGRIAAASRHVSGFSAGGPHGMLQHPDTVRAMFSTEAGAAARLQNHRLLDDPARQFEYVMVEGALGCNVLPPEGWIAQLRHLITLAERSNVRIGIIEVGTVLPWFPVGTWETYDRRAVIASMMNGSVTLVDPRDLQDYLDSYVALQQLARWGDDARSLIERNIERYRAL